MAKARKSLEPRQGIRPQFRIGCFALHDDVAPACRHPQPGLGTALLSGVRHCGRFALEAAFQARQAEDASQADDRRQARQADEPAETSQESEARGNGGHG